MTRTSILTIPVIVACLAAVLSCNKNESKESQVFIPFAPDAEIPADLAIDLGTGIKWRSGNLGAAYAHEGGDYYAWGETEYYYVAGDARKETPDWKQGKEAGYDWSSYKFTEDNGATFTKYTNNGDVLQPEDDAAHVILQGKWRMPTWQEFKDLRDKCDWEPVTLRNVNGYKVTSKSDPRNYIFLPYAGTRLETGIDWINTYGNYWTATRGTGYKNRGRNATFGDGGIDPNGVATFCHGFSIRPVLDL